MAKTKIEWTAVQAPDGTWLPGETFNPWWGCQAVSPACKNCYAETFDRRLGGDHWGPNAPFRFFPDAHWNAPRKLNAKAAKLGIRLRVFCGSMCDWLQDRTELEAPRARLLRLIDETPAIDWLMLSKRPENLAKLTPWAIRGGAPPNVKLGATVENQEWAERRLLWLLDMPARGGHFLSVEPPPRRTQPDTRRDRGAEAAQRPRGMAQRTNRTRCRPGRCPAEPRELGDRRQRERPPEPGARDQGRVGDVPARSVRGRGRAVLPETAPAPRQASRPGRISTAISRATAPGAARMSLEVVALSGGKDSTAMALRLAELEPDTPRQYLCTPTGDELPEMEAHWKRLEVLLGAPLVRLTNGTLRSWIEHWNALPNWRQRWCTRELKIRPCVGYLKQLAHQGHEVVLCVGLRADEPAREGVIYDDAKERHPLREWGWGLHEVKAYLRERCIEIPQRTDCARCPMQTLFEWWMLWRYHPSVYADAEAQEAMTGHTFRSAGRDTWPAGLRELRLEFERGRKPSRGMQLSLFEQACRVCRL